MNEYVRYMNMRYEMAECALSLIHISEPTRRS